MGGSGGRYFSSGVSPLELRRQVEAAQASSRSEGFESDLANLLDGCVSEANSRNPENLQRHIDSILNALEQDIEGGIVLRYGGSILKRTFVDGLSDADGLVILNKSELKDRTPDQVRSYFASRLCERFKNTEVIEGRLAVTVKFSDIEVQLIPALRDEKGLRIPSQRANEWSRTIRPDMFAKKLTAVNQALNSKAIPAIKVAKQILSQLSEKQQLTGYHVESLAIAVFRNYNGPKTTKDLVRKFFAEAARFVRQPIKDSTGQSIHVDDYLGAANSLQRRIAADALQRIGRAILNADGAESLPQWKSILGEN